MRVLADNPVDRETVSHLLDRHRHEVGMATRDFDKILKVTGLTAQVCSDVKIRKRSREICFPHRKLKFTAGLKNFISLRGLADFDLDVEQPFANLHIC